MTGFVKLYSTILTSSIWLESDSTLRVWIAMLSTADENGYVGASVGGLAHVSRVSREDCVTALETFMAPDPDSRTEDHDGRRIEKVDGGWLILNHRKYRDMRTQKQIRDAERIAEKRATGEYDAKGPVATPATRSIVATDAEGEAEAEAKADTEKEPSPTARAIKLDDILEVLGTPHPARAHMLAMLSGMTEGLGTPGMKAVPVAVLHEAAVELRAAGGDFTPHRYKTFVAKVMERNGKQAPGGGRKAKGYTLMAAKLVERVKDCESKEHPGYPIGEWRSKFSAQELELIDAFRLSRIMTDKNEGTLVAQLARAMEEAGL